MRNRLIVLSMVSLVLITIGALKSFSTNRQLISQEQESEEKGTVKWHVKRAKAKGEQKVVIPTGVGIPAVIWGLDSALTEYTVVVAQPIGKKSYERDSYGIGTWYKLKVIEKLSQNISDCPICPSIEEVPAELLPLKNDEILLWRGEGTLIIDGVEVINEDPEFPSFSASQKYLLFFSLNSSTNIGIMNTGASGVFTIHSDGNIESLEKRPSRLKEDIETRYGNSLHRLVDNLKHHSVSR